MRAEGIMPSEYGTDSTRRGNPPWLPATSGRARGPAPTRACGALLVVLLVAGAAPGAQPQARTLLPETAVLDGIDGRIIDVDANEASPMRNDAFGGPDAWLFELAVDVNNMNIRVPAGTRFVLLPSVTLGKLIADVNDRAEPRYRLSARVTQYRGKNYLLPTYYLPLSKLQGVEDGGQKAEDGVAQPQSDDPNLAIPEEILKKLRERRPVRGPQKRDDGAWDSADSTPQSAIRNPQSAERMIVDRVGLIKSEGGRLAFVPYALGWNVSDERYELLPSSTLEQALRQQAGALEVIRWNVAGLVTEFQGRKYLLLQRAVPVYNYGDFGRS